jgi:hypothetical protein
MLTEEQVRPICERYLNDTINEVGMICYGYDEEETDYSHMLVTFYGGENACVSDKGKWSNYLINIKNLVEDLEMEFDKVWLVTLSVDCPDDVFSLVVAVKKES